MSRTRFLSVLSLVITITAPASAAQIVQSEDFVLTTDATFTNFFLFPKLEYRSFTSSEIGRHDFSFQNFATSLGTLNSVTVIYDASTSLTNGFSISPVFRDDTLKFSGLVTTGLGYGPFPLSSLTLQTEEISCEGPISKCFGFAAANGSVYGSLTTTTDLLSFDSSKLAVYNYVEASWTILTRLRLGETASTATTRGNLTLIYNYTPSPVSVPEPSQWLLMITGLLVTGAAMRRRGKWQAAIA